jgi:site-specific DNA-methyltransferase (adenine-specific)
MQEIRHGDCLAVMREMPDASVDAVVTDPPYGLAFMGKRWDYDVPSVEIWAECLRVLKPGGHLLAFAGTRTQHRMACRIEDAGFEIRDMIAWVYGSGFPKSLNVAAAIAKMAEPKAEPKAEEIEFCQWLRDNSTPEVVSQTLGRRFWDCEVQIVNAATKERPVMARRALVPTAAKWQGFKEQHQGTIPPWIEELAKPEPQRAETPGEEWTPGKGNGTTGSGDWQGWGTALKPALEPITVARKPLTGTVAENVLAHGTGALNVDGCRVGTDGGTAKGSKPMGEGNGIYGAGLHGACEITQLSAGRWPANLIHDGSEEVVGLFPANRPGAASNGSKSTGGLAGSSTFAIHPREQKPGRGDSGSAARFFYCAKASKRDRDEGCEGMEAQNNMRVNGPRESEEAKHATKRSNHHPTVKPTDLMRYLCRLVTPPGGIVLDPFAGSGSTGKAAALEGFRFIGIEREAEYVEIARARIAAAVERAGLFERTAS